MPAANPPQPSAELLARLQQDHGSALVAIAEQRASAVELAEVLGALCQYRGWRVTAAESCTGGGVAQAITAIAGSSAWFDMAFVSYSNAAKTQLLGVDADTLQRYGAVSEQTALAMALGARLRAAAHLAVAVSGVAGPSGGSAEKPVGAVCFAWAAPQGAFTATHRFAGDRAAVREQSVITALTGLISLACSSQETPA